MYQRFKILTETHYLRHLLVFVSLVFVHIPTVAQVYYGNLLFGSEKWDAERAESAIENNVSMLFEYQQCNVERIIIQAKEKYNALLVYHAIISLIKEDGHIMVKLSLEDSSLPFDLYYIDKRGNTKAVIPSDRGFVQYASTGVVFFARGIGKKMNRALRRIIRQKPVVIFTLEKDPFNYMYIKNDEVFYFDSFTRKTHLLIERISYLEQKMTDFKELDGFVLNATTD